MSRGALQAIPELHASRRSSLLIVCALLLSWFASPLPAQVNTGELRLLVTDTAGARLRASVAVTSQSNDYRKEFETDERGSIDIATLPYGLYQIRVAKPGFAARVTDLPVRVPVPIQYEVRLSIAPVNTVVQVQGNQTLVDPNKDTSVIEIGSAQIQTRVSSLPGRSVQDLVNSQPGWLYEGNAVLHPRGSEYQTQFVLDGIPLTDNRSPSFGPEIEADEIDSMSIYTAGIPAEYGRKMGGIVELNTRLDKVAGLHGQLVLSGGSYDTAASYGDLREVWGKNMIGVSASGSMTDHYLNPVVPENFTNTGTTGDFSANFDRDLTGNDRLRLSVRHELSRFLVPNELVQEQAGQKQNGGNFETVGTAMYQHTFSPNTLGTLSGMVRDNADDLDSNAASTPIIATQRNDFREGYFKGTISVHHGRQEFKTGVESDNTFLHENFAYTITDPTQFDSGTPARLSFQAARPDLEQAAFVEDTIHLGRWTLDAGLRWDHYQLLLNQEALSPRVSLGRYLPRLGTTLHASFDRVFQTPSFENILISSSTQIEALDPQFLRLPVSPSRGNYYEGGLSQGIANRARAEVNIYRRNVANYADDDQLLNTGVSYPISFRKAVIYGAEGKLEVVNLGRLTGFVSYSYMVGNAWLPVTGGLFLGDDAANAAVQLTGHFPDSQDQRNTVRTRFAYQFTRRVWFASGANFGSGLPFQYTGDEADALAQYGAQVIDRINFARGRIRPQLAVTASVGVTLYRKEPFEMHLQADGDNLNNRLNVIDFGGLFSGNAIAPARSYALRLRTTF